MEKTLRQRAYDVLTNKLQTGEINIIEYNAEMWKLENTSNEKLEELVNGGK